MVDTLLQGLVWCLQHVRSLPSTIYAALAWGLLALMFGSLVTAVRDTVGRSRQMHQIPCAGCQFFTNDYRLKCTLHPKMAATEAAINCRDFEQT